MFLTSINGLYDILHYKDLDQCKKLLQKPYVKLAAMLEYRFK